MKTIQILLFAFSIALILPSCVSLKKYKELELLKNHFKDEHDNLLSIQEEKDKLEDEKRFTESQLRQTTQELEILTVRTERLEKETEHLQNEYDKLLRQNKSLLSNASIEKQGLEEALATNQDALDLQQRELEALEYTLSQREQRLSGINKDLKDREAKINELQSLLDDKDAQMAHLKSSLNEVLRGFSAADLSVSERDGKIYVSLSQNLLFKPGSDQIDFKGKNAIKQLADVLLEHPDMNINVEGHTDDSGNANFNWDLSVKRATSVVKILTAQGLDPKKITASGRGLYAPLVENDNPDNKAKNRRTEIILSPKLDALYEIIK